MKNLFLLLIVIAFASCAKIPVQTVALTDAIIDEGKRMHELNIAMLNSMFSEKREKIDMFIKDEYTPHFLEEFNSRIPAGTDYQKEFPGMIQSIIPQITSRRNEMQSALETQRVKLITKLNADYQVFEEAAVELGNLIESAARVNEERNKAFEQVKDLTNNKIDLNQINTEIDSFILKAGALGGNVSGNINELNSKMNSLINN
jgi:hypothetical protein